MQKRIWAMALGLLALSAARAEAQDDNKTCRSSTAYEARIAACTRLIDAQAGDHGNLSDHHANRAYAHGRLGSAQASRQDFAAALRLDPQNFLAYSLRGDLAALQNNYVAAIVDYSHCLRLKPGSNVCRFLRGVSHVKARQYRPGISDLSVVIAAEELSGRKNSYAAAHAHRGLAHEALGQRAAAIRDYRIAVREDASLASIGSRLAALESGAAPPAAPAQGGDPEQYRQACHEPPNPQAGILACTRRIQAGGGATSKEQSDTFNSRAWWRYKAGQYRSALADADRAIALDPGSAPAYDTRGHIYRVLARRDAAIGDFRQALALNPSAETRRSAEQGLSAFGITATPAPGTPVNLTWRFRNNTGATVHVKMYARERNIWWPGARTNWRMDHVGPFAFTISCRYGEKVCYGAWQAGNTDRYWGVGFEDAHGCQNCCYACREGQTTQYNLNP